MAQSKSSAASNVAEDFSAVPKTSSGVHRRVELPPILEHPHPALSRPSVEVDPTDPAIASLADVLVAVMRRAPGCVGLSAPQIGENVRLFCMDVTGHRKAKSCAGLVVLANPCILSHSGNVVMREGCASVPNLTGDVARAAEVVVTGFVPGTGDPVVLEANAIEARCILHEIDHLDGYLFIDRVQDPVAELFVRKRY